MGVEIKIDIKMETETKMNDDFRYRFIRVIHLPGLAIIMVIDRQQATSIMKHCVSFHRHTQLDVYKQKRKRKR